ncbi:MAG: hypothetical protein ACRD1K_20675 [Acidimicrobiales bacterium]
MIAILCQRDVKTAPFASWDALRAQWESVALAFRVELITIDDAGGSFPELQPARDQLRDHEWVFITPKGTVDLRNFEHPKQDVVYAFGRDFAAFDFEEPSVRIATPRPTEFYSHIAAAIVLWDRTGRSL